MNEQFLRNNQQPLPQMNQELFEDLQQGLKEWEEDEAKARRRNLALTFQEVVRRQQFEEYIGDQYTTADGRMYDLSDIPTQGLRRQFLDSKMSNSGQPANVVSQDLQLPSHFSADASIEALPAPKSGRSRRRMVILGASGLALTSGLVVSGVSGGIPGSTNANIAHGEAAATPAAPAEGQLSAADIAIGDCLDDTGAGKALATAAVAAEANMQWKIKTLDGQEAVVKTTKPNATDSSKKDDVYPHLALADATLNTAACITPEARKDAITVEGGTVKVNWDKVDRQLGIVTGQTAPTSEAWQIAAKPGKTDEATVATLTSDMRDPANTSLAVSLAEAEVVKKISADEKELAQIQTKLSDNLIAEINQRVAGLYAAKKSTVEKVTVEFTGTPKSITYKGVAAAPSPKFNVTDVAITKFDLK